MLIDMLFEQKCFESQLLATNMIYFNCFPLESWSEFLLQFGHFLFHFWLLDIHSITPLVSYCFHWSCVQAACKRVYIKKDPIRSHHYVPRSHKQLGIVYRQTGILARLPQSQRLNSVHITRLIDGMTDQLGWCAARQLHWHIGWALATSMHEMNLVAAMSALWQTHVWRVA